MSKIIQIAIEAPYPDGHGVANPGALYALDSEGRILRGRKVITNHGTMEREWAWEYLPLPLTHLPQVSDGAPQPRVWEGSS